MCILWVDEFRSHHFETMGNHCLLVTGEPNHSHGLLGGAGVCPSTVSLLDMCLFVFLRGIKKQMEALVAFVIHLLGL